MIHCQRDVISTSFKSNDTILCHSCYCQHVRSGKPGDTPDDLVSRRTHRTSSGVRVFSTVTCMRQIWDRKPWCVATEVQYKLQSQLWPDILIEGRGHDYHLVKKYSGRNEEVEWWRISTNQSQGVIVTAANGSRLLILAMYQCSPLWLLACIELITAYSLNKQPRSELHPLPPPDKYRALAVFWQYTTCRGATNRIKLCWQYTITYSGAVFLYPPFGEDSSHRLQTPATRVGQVEVSTSAPPDIPRTPYKLYHTPHPLLSRFRRWAGRN